MNESDSDGMKGKVGRTMKEEEGRRKEGACKRWHYE